MRANKFDGTMKICRNIKRCHTSKKYRDVKSQHHIKLHLHQLTRCRHQINLDHHQINFVPSNLFGVPDRFQLTMFDYNHPVAFDIVTLWFSLPWCRKLSIDIQCSSCRESFLTFSIPCLSG